jgi:CHASE1-domain containing sensor protein
VVAGRNWKLKFESDPVSTPWLRPVSLFTLGAGIVMSLLLSGIFRAIAHGRAEAVELARRATRDLRTQLSFTQ